MLGCKRSAVHGHSNPKAGQIPVLIMSSFEDVDTEETVTSLHMTLYHPGHQRSGIFQSIKFCNRETLPTSEVVKFGRNSSTCRYTFQDKQVSRVQFSLQLFKKFDSSVVSFEIKNMSKKTNLLVDDKELGYLNKMDLPDKCLIRFGDYQFLVEKEDGESLEFFEIQFFLSIRPLLQENKWLPQKPTPECGSCSPCSTQNNSPTEAGENEW
ncbi:hypothetical protein R6Z07F_007449 [Ovis aries]